MSQTNEPTTNVTDVGESAPDVTLPAIEALAALRGIDPDIDPAQELADHPRLLALLDPATGLTAEEAYYLVHRREIRERDIREAAEKITNAVLSGSFRPTEAAGNARPAPAPIDYRHVPRETREALKKRIRQAAARGERVYPGQ